MTIENDNVPRALGTLLSMQSFQDMSDEEITLIIAHKENMAYTKGMSDAVATQAMKTVEDNRNRTRAIYDRMARMIQLNGEPWEGENEQ